MKLNTLNTGGRTNNARSHHAIIGPAAMIASGTALAQVTLNTPMRLEDCEGVRPALT